MNTQIAPLGFCDTKGDGMNQRPFDEPARELIRQLTRERDAGFEFVPLVGAGLSAPSGVPIIREVLSYLRRCLAMALGLDHVNVWDPDAPSAGSPSDEKLEFFNCRRWLPGRDEWPPFGDPQIYDRDTVNWERRLEQVLTELRRRAESHPDRDCPELEVFQEGFGAAAEWRSLLLFLSRLRLRNPGSPADTPNHALILGPPDLDIVDTFFLNVVEGKQPTLGHRMLARLVGPLRINTVLTTNFDELLEQSFAEMGNQLVVFDVHVESGLPPYRNMQHKNALVKLHGGRYGLRADYSLDKPPTDNDLRHFVSYLAARHIGSSLWGERNKPIPARRHLIVCGMSGADRRITLMVREAVQRLSGLRIFWIAFSETDEEIARELERQCAELRNTDGLLRDDESPWFFIVRHHFPGLLFLRCFQGLTRSLPSSRAIFPSSPRLPVPPELIETDRRVLLAGDAAPPPEADTSLMPGVATSRSGDAGSDAENRMAYSDQIAARIKDCVSASVQARNWRRVVFVSGSRGQFLGASTAAAKTFGQELDRGRQCVWIDLDEIASCNDLFEVVLHTVARKAGVTDWMPVLLLTEDSDVNQERVELEQLTEISRLTNNPNRDWVIFLNGRCGAGANFVSTREYERYRECYPNGWLDWRKNEKTDPAGFNADGPTTSADAVIGLLDRLCGPKCPNVSVVFLCYEGPFFEAVCQMMPRFPDPVGIGHNELRQPAGPRDSAQSARNVESSSEIVEMAHRWIDAPGTEEFKTLDAEPQICRQRQEFLYALSLTNRVRYPASMWTWPFHWGQEPTPRRVALTDEWLSDLEALHVIRRKRGGFIWMHCDIRNRLRLSIPELKGIRDNDDPLQQWTAAIHHGLAEWNQKLLVASDTPSPAFEIVYHRCQQCVAMLEWGQVTHGEELLAALSDARRALETARPFMLSVGFSKSVCRRLQQVRDTYIAEVEMSLQEALRKESNRIEWGVDDRIRHRLHLIRITSLRLNRMIAREVGENMVAFRRHRELRAWQFVVRNDSLQTHEEKVDAVRAILGAFIDPSPENKAGRKEVLDLSPGENAANWIESCNEVGTLGLAVRSFEYSYASFQRVLDKFGFSDERADILDPGPVGQRNDPVFYREIREPLVKWLTSGIPRKYEELSLERMPRNASGMAAVLNNIHAQLVKTFQRMLQMLLAKGTVLLTVSRRACDEETGLKLFRESQQCFERAQRCTDVARLVLNILNRDDQRFAARDRQNAVVREDLSRWFDDRQRMETLDALAHSAAGDFERALRRLNEAEAALNEARHDHHAMERAIIDLHRVEVLTQQAMFSRETKESGTVLRAPTDGTSMLSDLRHAVLTAAQRRPGSGEADCRQSGEPPSLPSLLEILRGQIRESSDRAGTIRDGLRSSLSSLKDAWQTLIRAERQLKRHRKNVWWTTWFFELQLKVVELRVFAAVFERVDFEVNQAEFDPQLPHIGLQAAPHGTPTIVDRLLDNADRMVRLDLYRIARSAESYANCVLCLALWRACLKGRGAGTDWTELGRRQDEMRARLVGEDAQDPTTWKPGIRASIASRMARRAELDSKWKLTELDPSVKDYVEYVQKHIDAIADMTLRGLWNSQEYK